MRAYRFHSIVGFPHIGLLAANKGEVPKVAKFLPHNGFSKHLRPLPKAIQTKRVSRMDQFADYLADGLSVRDAASRMGYSYEYGNAMLQRIRKKLGRQAI